MKCLGCDRCEVRLGSWRSSDASLNTNCLGCDRCEVRLGSWRSSDASLNTKCSGCVRCEVRLGAWRSSDTSLRNESSFLALVACERVIPPTRQSQKELQLARLCNQLQPTCASQKWQLASQISSSLTSTKMHINLSEIVWVGGQSECWFLLVISTDEMSLNLSRTMN